MHTATPICTSLNRTDAGTARKWAVLWCIMHTMQKRKERKKKKKVHSCGIIQAIVSWSEGRLMFHSLIVAQRDIWWARKAYRCFQSAQKKKSALLTWLSGPVTCPTGTQKTQYWPFYLTDRVFKSVDDWCRCDGEAHDRENEQSRKLPCTSAAEC